MRPVERGPWPMTSEGEDIAFESYKDAKPYLQGRIGGYCSFCERPVSVGLAVEHICAKNESCSPELEREWSNFLLACTNCNSTKLTKIKVPDDLGRYLLPDRDRTFDAFDYTAGVVRVAELDDRKLERRAHETDELVGLTRNPARGLSSQQIRQATDTRYRDRRRAWQKAKDARVDLLECDVPAVRRRILAEAQDVGFWSVWMSVFSDDEEMQAALCDGANFPGTAQARLYPLPRHVRPLGVRRKAD